MGVQDVGDSVQQVAVAQPYTAPAGQIGDSPYLCQCFLFYFYLKVSHNSNFLVLSFFPGAEDTMNYP